MPGAQGLTPVKTLQPLHKINALATNLADGFDSC